MLRQLLHQGDACGGICLFGKQMVHTYRMSLSMQQKLVEEGRLVEWPDTILKDIIILLPCERDMKRALWVTLQDQKASALCE